MTRLKVGSDIMTASDRKREHDRAMKRHKPGRKRMAAEEKKSANRFNFGATPKEAENIRQAAAQEHLEPNAYCRKTVLDASSVK